MYLTKHYLLSALVATVMMFYAVTAQAGLNDGSSAPATTSSADASSCSWMAGVAALITSEILIAKASEMT